MIVPEFFQRSMPKIKKKRKKALKKREKISLKQLYGKKAK
jgi:hypothetical protein